MTLRRISWVGVAGVLLFSVGCGGKAGHAVVYGKVTYNGAPVTRGNVQFFPIGQNGKAAAGTIAPSGDYTINEVKYGDYQVTVVSMEEPTQLPEVPSGGALRMQDMALARKMEKQGQNIVPKSLIPEKYAKADSSGLKVTIDAKKISYDIELTD